MSSTISRKALHLTELEEEDFLRSPDGRFAFSRKWADVNLLQERGYFR
jgi:hypothetical protein